MDMEGKCVLFKAFGDVDAFPTCVKTRDVDAIVETIYQISGAFGGVNLEDIRTTGRARFLDKLGMTIIAIL